MKIHTNGRTISVPFTLVALVILALFYFFTGGDKLEGTDKDKDTLLTTASDGKTSTSQSISSSEVASDFDFERAYIKRVVDGDTAIVEIDDEEVRLRFSGVNTPESVGDYKDNPQFYGKEASAYTKEKLSDKWVYLEYDSKKYDKYDRLLAYVWLEEPNEDKNGLFNAELISEGYAKHFDDWDNKKYKKYFKGLEKEAKKAKLGMWNK